MNTPSSHQENADDLGNPSPSVHSNGKQNDATVGLLDLAGFLIGNRKSIERVLTCRNALLFGGVMVTTAAVAREYDTVSLLHEPTALFAPFAASLVIATLLFLSLNCALAIGRWGMPASSNLAIFLRFIVGYWWTAPLAWCYAVPIEIMTDELSAVRFNLGALTLVSLWRVALFSRVVSVIYRLPYWIALSWVLVPCMVVAFIGLMNIQLNLVGIMGGVRLTRSEEIVVNFSGATAAVLFWGIFPVIAIAIAGIVLSSKRSAKRRSLGEQAPTLPPLVHRLSWTIWLAPVAISVVLGWGLWYFQPKLIHAKQVDAWILSEDFQPAFQKMQEMGRSNFPHDWDPPPKRKGYDPQLFRACVQQLETNHQEPWIAERLLQDARRHLLNQWQIGYLEDSDQAIEHHVSRNPPEETATWIADLTRVESLLPPGETREELAHLKEVLERGIEQHTEPPPKPEPAE